MRRRRRMLREKEPGIRRKFHERQGYLVFHLAVELRSVCKLVRSGSVPGIRIISDCGFAGQPENRLFGKRTAQAGLRTGSGYSRISISRSSFEGRDKSGTRLGSE